MASPATLGSRALRSSRQPLLARPSSRRGLAAAASGSFNYQTGEAAGVKYASRDLPGATTTLTVVSKAGTRFQPYPGYSDALEKFAYKSTQKRSSLRITREVELLGGLVSAYHTRENLVLRAKFLRSDLPYFAELLAEVISKTRYTTHELNEEVLHTMRLSQKALLGSPLMMAQNSVHGVAFHRGLGEPLFPTSSVPITKYLDAVGVADFSDAAYAKSNVAVVGNGTSHEELGKWVNEFFGETGSGSEKIKLAKWPSKYYGGEERIAHGSANTLILGFAGSSSFTSGTSYKPEIHALSALLGGVTSIKWSPGFTLLSKAVDAYRGVNVATSHAAYSDAGLLTITLTGNANSIREAAAEVVQTIKKVANGEVSEEEAKKAVALAKFRALEEGESTEAGLRETGNGLIGGGKAYQADEVAKSIEKVSSQQIKSAAKSLLDSKASVSAVGDLYALPFAEEIGLKV